MNDSDFCPSFHECFDSLTKFCIIVWRPFCVRVNFIHIYAQFVIWSAGISYPHSRACTLIGLFLLGFIIVTAEKGKALEIVHSDARLLVTFFCEFILRQQGTCFSV
jgi:hypothetical protein